MTSNIIILFFILSFIFPFIKSECPSNLIEISFQNPSRCLDYTKIINKESGLLMEKEVISIYEKYKGKVTSLTSEVKFEILKPSDFKSYKSELDSSVSTIEVTNDCVNTLVGTTHKSDMYIFKFDIISSSSSFNKVSFSLFYDEDFIDNPICTSSPIIITYPININDLSLNDIQKERMKLVIEQEYDPFNKNSDFFTDICTQFTSEDKTDVPLDDRKEDYFISINACDSENENSIYDSYIIGDDSSYLFIKCAYGKFTTEDEKKEAIDIVENGINTVFTHSNLKIVKCNKMLFKLKHFKKNYGSWIIMILFVLQIIFLVFYLIYGTKGIYEAIKEFFKKKNLYFKNEDQKTKNEEQQENGIPTMRSGINKSKTKEVRKSVTENLEIRYQDYANPPLKKKNSNYENNEYDDQLEFNANINIQKPNVNEPIIRTQMSMVDTFHSKDYEDNNKKSPNNNNVYSNFKKVNSNTSDNYKKVNSNMSDGNNINFEDLDDFENNEEELIYQENEDVDLGKVDNRVPTNNDNEEVKMLNNNNEPKKYNNPDDRPIKSNGFYDFENFNIYDKPKNYNDYDDRPIRSNGFYNLESLDSGSMNDLLLSSQNKNTNNNNNKVNNKANNKVNNKVNNKNNVTKNQEVKDNNQQKLNSSASKFEDVSKNNKNKEEVVDNQSKKEIPKINDKNPINQTNNSPNNPLIQSANNIPIQRINSRYAHLQMSADNPFNTNPNQNTYNNYPIKTYDSLNENIDNVNNKNENIKNNLKANNYKNNENKLNKSLNQKNNNDEIGPITGINVAKSTSFNELNSTNKRDNALKILNGTSLHRVDEDQDQENSMSNDEIKKDSEVLKIESSNKNKFNNIDINQSNSLQKVNSKSNSNVNYYPSDLNDRKSYKRNTKNEDIEENIQEENKNEENAEVNRSNRSNKSDVIGTTGHLFDYTDEELNDLPYEKAFYADGRSYYCYYWSILKYDQLFLFSFILWSDFNLRLVKVSLFFFHIPMYITFNGFFFSYTAARNLYKKKGIINLIERLPSSIFSSLICFVIVIVLKCLCLSQKKVQEVRSSKTFDEAYQKTKILVEKMKPRIIIYFVLMFIFMIIFIYYISLFCAVFKNTQWKLFQETAISFALGMFYPFIICIFPTIFRKIGLIKQKKCSYKFSQFLQLF